MQRKTKTFFSLLVSILLLSLFVLPVRAEGETIPASGEICAQGICNTIQITFPPKGGPVSGTLSGQGSKDGCTFNNDGTISGTFAGGDGGQISGSIVWTMTASCSGNSISQSWSGTWQGNLSASGTGSGDGSVSGVGATWTLSFSGEDFQRILTPITKEYFKATYGIEVKDGKSAWTDEQLIMLDNVLKILPADFLKKSHITTISREDIDIDKEGKKQPNTYGIYDQETKTINFFDRLFMDDSSFKDELQKREKQRMMMHEIAHAFQFYKDANSTFDEETVYESDLMGYFAGAVLDNQDDNNSGWGFKEVKIYEESKEPTQTPRPDGKWGGADLKSMKDRKYRIELIWWFYGTKADNQPPTSYAGKNPVEDFAESVSLYVANPQELLKKSPNRYAFVKNEVFGGKEFKGF